MKSCIYLQLFPDLCCSSCGMYLPSIPSASQNNRCQEAVANGLYEAEDKTKAHPQIWQFAAVLAGSVMCDHRVGEGLGGLVVHGTESGSQTTLQTARCQFTRFQKVRRMHGVKKQAYSLAHAPSFTNIAE